MMKGESQGLPEHPAKPENAVFTGEIKGRIQHKRHYRTLLGRLNQPIFGLAPRLVSL